MLPMNDPIAEKSLAQIPSWIDELTAAPKAKTTTGNQHEKKHKQQQGGFFPKSAPALQALHRKNNFGG